MQNKRKYFFSALLFIVLIIFTYQFLFKNYNPKEVLIDIFNCNSIYIIMAFIAMLVFLFFDSYYMKRVLKYLNINISLLKSLGYSFTEIYFSAITPSSMGGQPVQMYEMKKDKIPYETSAVVVLLKTVISKAGLLFLAFILFLVYHSLLFTRNHLFQWFVYLGFITTILVTLMFGVLIYSKKISNLLMRFIYFVFNHNRWLRKKDHLPKKLENMLNNYHECALLTKKYPKMFLESFLILLGRRICLLSVAYFVYSSFSLTEHNILELIFFQITITLGSDLMPTPGGVMVNEALAMEANELLYGAVFAMPGMLITRFISFYLLVLTSAIGYIIFHFKKRHPVHLQ